ncbi:hypothetical protein ScPMuIL_009924 [Solemya velum]
MTTDNLTSVWLLCPYHYIPGTLKLLMDMSNAAGSGAGSAISDSEFESEEPIEDQSDLIQNKQTAKGLHIEGRRRTNRLTDDEIEKFTSEHNKYRRQEGSSDMSLLTWDTGLAEQAQALVDTCVYKHTNVLTPNGEMTGQNMGAVRNGQNVENMITKIIKLWYDEKKFIQQADGMFMCEPGKKCGHYIEVVNSNTKRIGCAYKFCNTVFWKVYGSNVPRAIRNKNVFFQVCQYSQPGVIRQYTPYLTGQPCGNCSEDASKGYMCVDGLCVSCPDGSPDCIKPPCTDSIVPKTEQFFSQLCKYLITNADDCKRELYYRDKCLERCRELVTDVEKTNFWDLYPYVIDVSRC